jgi:hypothetical protein
MTSIVQSTCRLAIGLLPLSALCEPSGSLGGSYDLQKAAECLVRTRCQARLCNGGLFPVYCKDRRSRPCFLKRNTNLELDKKAISTRLKLLGWLARPTKDRMNAGQMSVVLWIRPDDAWGRNRTVSYPTSEYQIHHSLCRWVAVSV